MKTKLLFLVSSLAFAGIAYAQNMPSSGVVESTDPAKIADIERRAHQLGAMSSAAPAEDQAMSQKHQKMHDRMHKRMHKHGHKHHDGMKGKHSMKDGKHLMKDGEHPMHDGKGPHGAMPMMEGKGAQGAKPMGDAPAKP